MSGRLPGGGRVPLKDKAYQDGRVARQGAGG